jgi:hypothetical protein
VNAISTYSTAGSVASSSNFPGSTLVELEGGNKIYWKSVPTPTTQFELVGMDQPSGLILTYTNTALLVQWPVAMGYSVTDVFSGTLSIAGQTGTAEGTITLQGTGTGSLMLPGGFPVHGILQTRMTQSIVLYVASLNYTNNITSTGYSYYHSTQKFPLVSIEYEREAESVGTPTISNTVKIQVNNSVLTGINEKNFDATFQIFPNPAKDAIHINLSNLNAELGTIEIYNLTGILVKQVVLGTETSFDQNISINDLSSGIYLVKTKIGRRTSSRKLIVE